MPAGPWWSAGMPGTARRTFHADAADVLAAAGFDVQVLPEPLPTPVLAFAVRHLGRGGRRADHGVAQPARGQRVQAVRQHRWPDRAADRPARSRRRSPACRRPCRCQRARTWTTIGPIAAGGLSRSGGGVAARDRARHADRADADARCRRGDGRGSVAAGRFHRRAGGARTGRAGRGLPDRRVPEPGGAGRDRSAAGAGRCCDADLAIALDPDADRCAIGVRVDGAWRMLRGDETGPLLG